MNLDQEQLDGVLAPYFVELKRVIAENKQDFSKLPVPQVTVPPVVVPEIKVPEIKVSVPEVKIPPFPEIPRITVPKPEVTVNVDAVKIKNWPKLPEFDDKAILAALKRLENKTSGGGGGASSTNFFDTVTGKYIDVSSDNPLPTTATINTGDIEIGAVEIKNGSSDQRATVDTFGGLNVTGTASPYSEPVHMGAFYDDGESLLPYTLRTDVNHTLRVTFVDALLNSVHPLTDTELRANPVPISGSVTVSATDLDIRDLTSATDSVEVKQATGTNLHVVVDTAPTTAVTGTFWQATQPVSLASVPSHAVTNAGTFAVQADTELPAATLIADDEALPTTSRIGAIVMGKDAAGAANVDVARLAKAHDLDTGAGTEYGTGVSLRVEASGGSIPQTYGAGAVAAGTQRVTHASDDPAVTALQLIDNAVSGAGFNITQHGGVTVTAAAAMANDTASPTSQKVASFGMVRDVGDGNWDMQTAIQAAPNLAAADSGVTAVGLMAQLDDTSPTAITENQFGNVRMGTNRGLILNYFSDYPYLTTPETASSGNVANANAVATLAAAVGKTTYISGCAITSTGATIGAVVNVTIVGVITGTMTLNYAAPAGVSAMGTPLILNFNPPIPASATNTTIVVTLPALGAGNTNAAVTAWGYQL